MYATDILRSEHRVIERVLACLHQMAVRGQLKGKLDVESARLAIDFLRHFADHCHHGKEEHQLFPLLEARGIPRRQGPVGVMLDEHQEGRRCLRNLAAAVEDHANGAPDALRRFADSAQHYVELMLEHIDKEDHRLFTMADLVLTESDQHRLTASFEHMEHAEMGPGTHEKYLRIADELTRRFGIRSAPGTPAAACGCCCGHAAAP
jgi:hemerythrin-like domain-containing protein